MKRRDFIKYSCLGITSSFIPKGIFALHKISSLNENIIKPVDLKLNVKPLYTGRIHRDAYGGPCRWRPISGLTSEAETQYFPLGLEYLATYLQENIPDKVIVRLAKLNIKDEIKNFRPHFVGISAVSQNFNKAKSIASLCKRSKIFVIVGLILVLLP